MRRLIAVGTASVLTLFGCGGDDSAQLTQPAQSAGNAGGSSAGGGQALVGDPCVSGATAQCACADGRVGAMSCGPASTFSECECTGPVPGGTGGAASGAGGALSNGGGAPATTGGGASNTGGLLTGGTGAGGTSSAGSAAGGNPPVAGSTLFASCSADADCDAGMVCQSPTASGFPLIGGGSVGYCTTTGCTDDAQCPAFPGTSATPHCSSTSSNCYLDCTSDSDCAVGFTCVNQGYSQRCYRQ